MRHLSCTLILLVLASVPATGQTNPPPKIEFDVPEMVSCIEVTTPEFASTHSLEKLLEVHLKASSLLDNGNDRCIRELFFFIYSPDRSFQVVDFSPQTTLITEFAGPIDESENKENSNNAGFNFSPTFEMAGKANINASVSDRKGTTLRTSKLPPKQLAVASGTQKRGTAVYFKLKPSSQLTLEGTHEIVLTIKVPIAWRADLMHVHCAGQTAWSAKGGARKSRSDFVVPVHLASDAAAKVACERFVDNEINLRNRASRVTSKPKPQKRDIASRVTVFVKREILGRKQKTVERTHWLGNVIFADAAVEDVEGEIKQKLSPSTVAAINDFRSSKQQILKLNE